MKPLDQIRTLFYPQSVEEIFKTHYKTVLHFITYFESLNEDQISRLNELRLSDSRRYPHYTMLERSVRTSFGNEFYDKMYNVLPTVIDGKALFLGSILEIILLDKLLDKNVSLFYLPLFDKL